MRIPSLDFPVQKMRMLPASVFTRGSALVPFPGDTLVTRPRSEYRPLGFANQTVESVGSGEASLHQPVARQEYEASSAAMGFTTSSRMPGCITRREGPPWVRRPRLGRGGGVGGGRG